MLILKLHCSNPMKTFFNVWVKGRKGSRWRGGSRWCISWHVASFPGDRLLHVVVSLCLSGGLALAQVLFFYVKYLVLFGVPALLMRLDGLTPPPLPRCVSTMFSFTGMWRSVPWPIKALWGCAVQLWRDWTAVLSLLLTQAAFGAWISSSAQQDGNLCFLNLSKMLSGYENVWDKKVSLHICV